MKLRELLVITVLSSSIVLAEYQKELNGIQESELSQTHRIAKREAQKQCRDLKGYCAQWARRNYCSTPRYRPYMKKNCRDSCNLCGGEQEIKIAPPTTTSSPARGLCEDNHKSCKLWKSRNYCNVAKYSDFMKSKCSKTCGWCKDHQITEQVTTVAPSSSPYTEFELTTINLTSTQKPSRLNATVATAEQYWDSTTTSQQDTSTLKTVTIASDFNTVESQHTSKTITTNLGNDVTDRYKWIGSTEQSTSARRTEKFLETSTASSSPDTALSATDFASTASADEQDETTVAEDILISTTESASTTVGVTGCVDYNEKCPNYAFYCGLSTNVRNACPLTCGTCSLEQSTTSIPEASSETTHYDTTNIIAEMIATAATVEETTEHAAKEIFGYTTDESTTTNDVKDTSHTTNEDTANDDKCEDATTTCSTVSEYCIRSNFVRLSCPFTCGTCDQQKEIKITTTTSPHTMKVATEKVFTSTMPNGIATVPNYSTREGAYPSTETVTELPERQILSTESSIGDARRASTHLLTESAQQHSSTEPVTFPEGMVTNPSTIPDILVSSTTDVTNELATAQPTESTTRLVLSPVTSANMQETYRSTTMMTVTPAYKTQASSNIDATSISSVNPEKAASTVSKVSSSSGTAYDASSTYFVRPTTFSHTVSDRSDVSSTQSLESSTSKQDTDLSSAFMPLLATTTQFPAVDISTTTRSKIYSNGNVAIATPATDENEHSDMGASSLTRSTASHIITKPPNIGLPSSMSPITTGLTVKTPMPTISSTTNEDTTMYPSNLYSTAVVNSMSTEARGALEGCYDQLLVCVKYEVSVCQSSALFRDYCPKHCGLCDVETTTDFMAPPYTDPADTQCIDEATNCGEYVNFCDKSDDVKRQCRLSCGVCSPEESATGACEDFTSECGGMEMFCTGSDLSDDVRSLCPKTCNVCDVYSTTAYAPVTTASTVNVITDFKQNEDTCEDLIDNCDKLLGFCDTITQIKASCPLTCGECRPQTLPTSIPHFVDPVMVATSAVTDSTIITTPFAEEVIRDTTLALVAFSTQRVASTPTSVTGQEICEDEFTRCSEIAGRCNEEKYSRYLKLSCRKTCKFCTAEATDTDVYNPTQWTAWSSCSVTCGQGIQSRSKVCVNPNLPCTQSSADEVRGCVHKICSEDNICRDYIIQASCDRYKMKGACNMPAVTGLCKKTCGICVDQPSSPLRTPVKGALSSWTTWGDCSATCGEGTKLRTRSCEPIRVDDEPIFCDGAPTEERPCLSEPCTTETEGPKNACRDKNKRCRSWFIKGYCNETYTRYMRKHCAVSCGTCGLWAEWSLWSACSRNCGGGYQQRSRNCSTAACEGLRQQRRACNTESCYQPESACSDASTACFTIDPSRCADSFYTSVCKRTCGKCGVAVTTTYQCEDKDVGCPSVAAAGRCADPAVSASCPLSCNLCQSENKAPCYDKSESCSSLAFSGQCTVSKVAAACPLSCGSCPVARHCLDQSPKCGLFAMRGYCKLDPVNAMNCRKSCGLCGGDENSAPAQCSDMSDDCQNYLLFGSCTNEVIASQCQATCGYCESPCEDQEPTCQILAGQGYCDRQLISRTCPKSCGVCGQSALSTSCDDVSPMCASYAALNMCGEQDVSSQCRKSCNSCPEISNDATCADSNPQCEYFKNMKMCINEYIAKRCPKSCGQCGCEDSLDSCPLLVSSMKCDTPFVKEYCQKSCGTCGNPSVKEESECFDKIDNCQMIKMLGKCSDGVMGVRMCRKTCNLCGVRRKKCEDKIKSCANAALLGMCSKGSVSEVCEKSCKLCDPAEFPEIEEWDYETAVPVPSIDCGDQREEGCQSLRDKGYCNQKYIRDSCNQTCGVCAPINPGKIKVDQEDCLDATEQCTALAQGDACMTDGEIRFLCAKTCGTCIYGSGKTMTLQCTDNADGCENKKDRCHLPEIAQICKHTCEQCDQEGVDPSPETGATDSARQCADRMSGCILDRCYNDPYQSYVNAMCKKTCNLCEVDNHENYGTWGNWEECSVTCGGGTRVRYRVCDTLSCPEPKPVSVGICGKDLCPDEAETDKGEECEDFYPERCPEWARSGRCNMTIYKSLMALQCPHSCGHCTSSVTTDKQIEDSVVQIGNWSACSVSCGEGTRTRNNGDAVDVESCNAGACAVGWSAWSDWSDCTVTCGSGWMSRARSCLGEADDTLCEGGYEEYANCTLQYVCPDVGEWSAWTDTQCDVTCGNGTYVRTRDCYNGIRGKGGCIGKHKIVLPCELDVCPGPWSEWGGWSECTESCGTGYKTKIRTRRVPCNSTGTTSANPSPCYEEDDVFDMCNTRDCGGPTWGEWQSWTTCTASCGGGSALRQRSCEYKDRILDSYSCSDDKMDAFQSGSCNTHNCSSWSAWSEFTPCSSSCGTGVNSRLRTCEDGTMGSRFCPWGDEIEASLCESQPCFRDCEEESVDLDYLSYTTSSGNRSSDAENASFAARWCPDKVGIQQWIEVDLGSKKPVSGLQLTWIQLAKERADLLVSAMPVIFVVSHVPINTIRPENYIVQEETVVKPVANPETVSLSWNPVTDQIWRISTKFPATFDCLGISFNMCSYSGDDDFDGSGL